MKRNIPCSWRPCCPSPRRFAARRAAPTFDAGTISGLGARNIGSATMSGRIAALAAMQRCRTASRRSTSARPAAACGSRSTAARRSSRCSTSSPCSRSARSTIDPRNPKTVWVGTGESWTRNSRVDRRRHLQVDRRRRDLDEHGPAGVRAHRRRSCIDPKNSNTVYACVPGKLWSDSAERGVYKTTDGGKTWALVLKGANLSTGCSGLTMDPKNPDVALRRAVGLPPQGLDVPLRRRRPRRAERRAACSVSATAARPGPRSRREANKGFPAKP